jgi:uncharacterized protein (DUF736 family)
MSKAVDNNQKEVPGSAFTWHALDGGRGYLSVHLGEGMKLKVLTTPISEEPEEVRRVVMWEKVERENLKI